MAYVNLIDIVYPVGSLYFTSSATSPVTLFGGSWMCLQSCFVPESACTRVEGMASQEYRGSYDYTYQGDTINGICVAAGSTAGATGVWGGNDKYYTLIHTSFILGHVLSAAYNNSFGLKSYASIQPMGGSMTGRCFASNFNNDMDGFAVYDKSNSYGYSQFWGVNVVNIPTRTQCYIWQRTK